MFTDKINTFHPKIGLLFGGDRKPDDFFQINGLISCLKMKILGFQEVIKEDKKGNKKI